MKIIGIDPGYAIVGCGIIDYNRGFYKILEYGAITTSSNDHFSRKLEIIYNDLAAILKKNSPEIMAIEKLFFQNNHKTAIDVAQARGTILLCAQKHGLKIVEYTPLQVKNAVVGYGRAEKCQVMQMTANILSLKKIPKPDDIADALAIAVCHAHSSHISR